LPVFNGETHLSQAIESILTQSTSDFELLIANDQSTDGSLAIIEKYAKSDSRIRFWTNENRLGLFGNYNSIFNQAQGDYVKPFAQDDLLHTDCLEVMAGILRKHPAVIYVSCWRTVIDEEEFHQSLSVLENKLGTGLITNTEKLVAQCVFSLKNEIGEPAALMIRRTAVGRGFDHNFHQIGDLEYWLRLALKGPIYFVDQPLCTFRAHHNNTSHYNSKNFLYALDFMRLYKRFGRILQKAGISSEEFFDKCVTHLSAHIEYGVYSKNIHLENLGLSDLRLRDVYGLGADKRESAEQLFEDFLLFRELSARALHALSRERRLAVGSTEVAEEPANEKVDLSQKEKEIDASKPTDPQLEEVVSAQVDPLLLITARKLQRLTVKRELLLNRMLDSRSWRSTKHLRDFNATNTNRSKTRVKDLDRGLQTNLTSDASTNAEEKLQSLNLDRIAEQQKYLAYLRQRLLRIARSKSWSITQPLRFFSSRNLRL